MKNRIEDITLLGVMTGIIILMTAVPGIGFIPVGAIYATIVHTPVIVIAIVKGPRHGAILGGVMGVASLINAFLRPLPTSFIFMNPIISVLPRILIGLVTGYLALALRKAHPKKKLDIVIPAAAGSLTNTIGVLGLIYFIYAKSYMEAIGRTGQSAFRFLIAVAFTNGLVEMLLSVLIVTPIAFALIKYTKKRA